MNRDAAQKRPGRVLIVDDEPSLVEGLKVFLELDGLEVSIHTSLITLPLVVREFDPDVILLDLSMPALSGTALFAKGPRRLLRTDALVVLFSGRGARELSQLAEELGAAGFLPKDCEPYDAARRIATWIAHRRAMHTTGGHNARIRAASPAA
ncbi:MAG: response regulator [Acidobacteriota bacterium]|nr:response regulator [Acidobacteriota bacterium]